MHQKVCTVECTPKQPVSTDTKISFPSPTDLQHIQLADDAQHLSCAHLQSFELMQCQGAQTLLQAKQWAQIGDRRVGKIEALQTWQGADVDQARVVEVNVSKREGAKALQAAEAKANRLLQGGHGKSCEDKSLERLLQEK